MLKRRGSIHIHRVDLPAPMIQVPPLPADDEQRMTRCALRASGRRQPNSVAVPATQDLRTSAPSEEAPRPNGRPADLEGPVSHEDPSPDPSAVVPRPSTPGGSGWLSLAGGEPTKRKGRKKTGMRQDQKEKGGGVSGDQEVGGTKSTSMTRRERPRRGSR